jgi:hypothetical protein
MVVDEGLHPLPSISLFNWSVSRLVSSIVTGSSSPGPGTVDLQWGVRRYNLGIVISLQVENVNVHVAAQWPHRDVSYMTTRSGQTADSGSIVSVQPRSVRRFRCISGY